MASKSIITGNINIFEELHINQLGSLFKEDLRFRKLFTIWWGDLKTEVYILSIQKLGKGINQPYDHYQHLFPGLVL